MLKQAEILLTADLILYFSLDTVAATVKNG